MRALAYVGMVSLMALFPGVTSGGDVGACELSDEAARVLCTLADLLRASKHTADNYVQRHLEEPFEEVKLHKIIVDQNSELLEELLAKAVNEGKYTEKDADELESNAEGVQQVNDWDYVRAMEARARAREYQQWVRENTGKAIDKLPAKVRGERSNDATDLFTRKDYKQQMGKRTKEILENSTGIENSRRYCRDMGFALKKYLDKWQAVKENEANKNCAFDTETRNHAREVRDHMLRLAINLVDVERAKDNSLSYLALVLSLRAGVRQNRSIERFVREASDAVKLGVKFLTRPPRLFFFFP
ncbi:unnamed protein product, partial [Trypanosoma congolense IL3000]